MGLACRRHSHLKYLPRLGQCSGKLPNTRAICKDATAIMSVRIGDLLEKGGYDEFLQSDLVKMQKPRWLTRARSRILDDPEASGIDLGEPIHIFIKLGAPAEEFGEPTVTGGLITSKDAKPWTRRRFITAKAGYHLLRQRKGYTHQYARRSRNDRLDFQGNGGRAAAIPNKCDIAKLLDRRSIVRQRSR